MKCKRQFSSFVPHSFLLKSANYFEVGNTYGVHMKIFENRSWMIILGLALAMALTRFSHFGSSVALPDASLAVFFLGGLYLAKFSGARWVFVGLLAVAGLVDYYAIVMDGVSNWCMTPAYGFLVFAYGAMWFAGNRFLPRHTLTVRSLFEIIAVVTAASTLAFVISNVSFFLFSGRYAEMSAFEYASRVVQYLGSYVAVALMYVACAVAAHGVVLLLKGRAHSGSHVV
jgi:hypothetical protein